MLSRERVEEVIAVIRPAMQADGGDIVLHDIDPETGKVTVELIGACGECPMSEMDLKLGVERILKDRVEGVTEVISGTAVGLSERRLGTTVLHLVTPRHDVAALLDAAAAGDRVALARLLSAVERGGEEARTAGRLTFPRSGGAYTVGITGAPGSGKSTLTSALSTVVRARGERLAVLAVDPSSPFSGGAILGDRVRMQAHATDDGVYIRSMATRGNLGGLALATPLAIRVLDAVGWPWVVVETVGVGQVEVAIAGEADTTVVVVNPGWGDAVQANKAGLMEVADLFVINKADRPGVQDARRDILQMLELSSLSQVRAWDPPVVEAVAVEGQGAEAVWDAVARHRAHIESTGELAKRRNDRLRAELRAVLHHSIDEQIRARTGAGYQEIETAVLAREVDPYTAAERLLS